MRVLLWLHPLAWLAWILYWRIAAWDTKPTTRRDSPGYRLAYSLPVIAAFLCFWLPAWRPDLRVTLFPDREACWAIGTILLFAGMTVSVWARVVLGRNWSNVITIKAGHELVQTGPYRWVRHPIYTGILLALAGSALAHDFWTDLPVVPLAFIAFWIKLQREEDWMRDEFGAAYDAYCARTARLIPFLF